MRRFALLALVVATAVAALPLAAGAQEASGDPVQITDVHIEMDDGVRLAADVYLPPGTPTDGSVQVPCLVELTPYRKETRAAEGASLLPSEGFGLVEVDARGTGGSEGEYDIVFSLREQWDAAAVVDWAAEDSGWCTDRVGMFGGSYSGIIQYLVASLDGDRAPEHLAAIAPQRAYGDLYRDIVYHGGQVIGSFGAVWSSGTSAYYYQPPTNVTSPDGMAAWSDHVAKNDPMLVPYLEQPYVNGEWCSDDGATDYCQELYRDSSVLPRIDNLTVPTLHLAGWFDSFTRGQLRTFQKALERERAAGDRGPNYLIVGPWNHGGTHFIDPANFTDRLVDWYRHWLDDGPGPDWFGDDRVLYYEMGTGTLDDDTGAWRTAETWPPPADYARLYLRADGSLTREQPGADEGTVSYLYDPTAGVAEWPSRWDNAAGVPQTQTDQRVDGDRSGAAFVTPELDRDTVITGPIVLKLAAATEGVGDGSTGASQLPAVADQVAPPYHDTDWVVKVSDVAPDGTASLVTEGYLRASHRAVDRARSDVRDGEVVVPIHPHTRDALKPPVVGEVHDYLVEVWPTSKRFAAGHRIRLDVYSADTPNHLNLVRPARNTLHLAADQPSYVALPLAPGTSGAAEADGRPGDSSSPDSSASGDAASGSEDSGDLPATGTATGLAALLIGAAWAARTVIPGRDSGRETRRRA